MSYEMKEISSHFWNEKIMYFNGTYIFLPIKYFKFQQTNLKKSQKNWDFRHFDDSLCYRAFFKSRFGRDFLFKRSHSKTIYERVWFCSTGGWLLDFRIKTHVKSSIQKWNKNSKIKKSQSLKNLLDIYEKETMTFDNKGFLKIFNHLWNYKTQS